MTQAGRLPERGPRRMPSLWTIAEYWAQHEVFDFDLSQPSCFACGREPPATSGTQRDRWDAASGYLERAHLVDRCRGGLDGPQNIVPLCFPCHHAMPPFDVGEGQAAIEWVQAGGPWSRAERKAKADYIEARIAELEAQRAAKKSETTSREPPDSAERRPRHRGGALEVNASTFYATVRPDRQHIGGGGL